MATCTTATPLGEYGGDTYGEGTSPCDTTTPAGYGDGVSACDIGSNATLVGTVTKLASIRWLAHRTSRYGNQTFQADNYAECKAFVEAAVGRRLKEVQVAQPGRPVITYLRLTGTGY